MEKYIFKDGDKFKVYKEVSSTTVTLDQYPIRYIRDYLNGSTANSSSHWVELKAINSSGTNVALNKAVTAFPDGNLEADRPLSRLTDNNTATDNYVGIGSTPEPAYLQVDLGSEVQISTIQVWHYYGDTRTYYKTKTEVSQDGVKWIAIFDSDISGTYRETSTGKTTDLSSLSTTTKVYGIEEVADSTVETFTETGMDEDLLRRGLIATTFETSSIKVLTYSDDVNYSKKLKLAGTNSKMQILKMNYDFNMSADNITGIKSSLIEFVKDNSLDNIKIIFSLDSGATWKSIKDSALVDVNISSEQDILDKGLTEVKFNSLVQAELDLLYSTKKIRYAICLKEKDMDKVLSISKLKVLYN